jgi:S-adenosylmethionine:tRNA ribosyltransferase-isomerase
MNPKNLSIIDFNYHLPEEKIALYPLEERSLSKLLVYKNGEIQHQQFKNIGDFLPEKSCLVFNNTKVIHARLFFRKESGALIEVFCLDPYKPSNYEESFASQTSCQWVCMIGNAKKWKSGKLNRVLEINGTQINFYCELKDNFDGKYIIEFSWDQTSISFSEILDTAGILPIPPYLNRETEASDEERYQTIYAKNMGSVAAPTAGLHFSEEIIQQLISNQHKKIELTLHVGAGTFKPVSASKMEEHLMHRETVIFSLENIKQILEQLKNQHPIIAIGTTSCRSLESLFWHALKVKNAQAKCHELLVKQWDPYELECNYSMQEVLEFLILELESNNFKELSGTTELMIAPGYQFKIIKGLITNFHQPQSTLLLLVSALVGSYWKNIYETALKENYRFLSYGDSSLLLPA